MSPSHCVYIDYCYLFRKEISLSPKKKGKLLCQSYQKREKLAKLPSLELHSKIEIKTYPKNCPLDTPVDIYIIYW